MPVATPVSDTPPNRLARWVLPLGLGLAVALLLRLPLVLNAAAHLDSDLAVDGLTLADMLKGHIRLHFPGTPAIGTAPLVFCLPQAMVWGATPAVLVSGTVALSMAVILAMFWLARRVHGEGVALGALLPLVFASTGVLWLAGRMTGGHLAAVLWYALALAGYHACLGRASAWRWLALGVWCGFGLYLDGLTAFGTLGMGLAALVRPRWASGGRPWRVLGVFLLGAALGYIPSIVGKMLDPHDAYGEQFVSVFRPINPASKDVFDFHQADLLIREHLRILLAECLPRLVSGYRLPGFESEPPPLRPRRGGAGVMPVATTVLSLGLSALGVLALLRASLRDEDARARSVARAQVFMMIGVTTAFVLNRNIFNSDNYRYLVLLLVPQALGVGLFLRGLARLGKAGRVAGAGLAVVLGGLMLVSAVRWEQGQGWLDGLAPLRRPLNDPALRWLASQEGIGRIEGDYWDVYRLAFLLDPHPKAQPRAGQPDRFGSSEDLPGRRILVGRPSWDGMPEVADALRRGGVERLRAPGVVLIERPERNP